MHGLSPNDEAQSEMSEQHNTRRHTREIRGWYSYAFARLDDFRELLAVLTWILEQTVRSLWSFLWHCFFLYVSNNSPEIMDSSLQSGKYHAWRLQLRIKGDAWWSWVGLGLTRLVSGMPLPSSGIHSAESQAVYIRIRFQLRCKLWLWYPWVESQTTVRICVFPACFHLIHHSTSQKTSFVVFCFYWRSFCHRVLLPTLFISSLATRRLVRSHCECLFWRIYCCNERLPTVPRACFERSSSSIQRVEWSFPKRTTF